MPTRVTLSFDDGHPNDLKLGRLFRRLGLKATFYVPISNRENEVMKPSQVRRLMDMGFEIGSHGLTHRRLHQMEEIDARRELFLSRRGLERMLGARVRGFCFSGGKIRHPLTFLAAEEGYDYCRTTRMFRQYRMRVGNMLHTSLQWYPHSTAAYLRHLGRRFKPRAVLEFLRTRGPAHEDTAAALLSEGCNMGRPFHLWGHSYEFTSAGDWRALEEFLEGLAGRPGVEYVTNGELFDALPVG